MAFVVLEKDAFRAAIVAPAMFAIVTFAVLVFNTTTLAKVVFDVDALRRITFAVLMIAVLPTLTPTPGFVNVHEELE